GRKGSCLPGGGPARAALPPVQRTRKMKYPRTIGTIQPRNTAPAAARPPAREAGSGRRTPPRRDSRRAVNWPVARDFVLPSPPPTTWQANGVRRSPGALDRAFPNKWFTRQLALIINPKYCPGVYRFQDISLDLLYSVGVNSRDEQGRGLEDDPRGDDLSVRMPLPKLREK